MRLTARLIVLAVAMSATASATTIDDVFRSYGNLTTIAGRGQIRGGGVNGWEASMEGGDALVAELSRPHMAMADRSGNIYIADKDAHAIRRVTPQGTIHTIAGTNSAGFNGESGRGTDVQIFEPNGLYTLLDGTTYVLDLGNSRIRKLTTDGTLTTLIHDAAGISLGRGLWVSPDESLVYYASGSQVRKWTPAGGIETYADGFTGLGNIAPDPTDGKLVATDREGHRIYKIEPDGTKSVIAGNGDTFGGTIGDLAVNVALYEPRGIAFNPDGSYYVATHEGGQIWFVDDQDRIHLLIDGDANHTHAGDGEPLSTPGPKVSEVRAITIAPNRDLLIIENDYGYIRRVAWIGGLTTPGDFNQDGVLDVADIDLLTLEVRNGGTDKSFDVDADGGVSDSDRLYWVRNLKSTYLGDANLDGEFSSQDLVTVFQAGQYEDQAAGNSAWSTGDWDGDGDFTSRDFVVAFQDGGYEAGPRPVVAEVPEPSSFVGLLMLCVFSFRGLRFRDR